MGVKGEKQSQESALSTEMLLEKLSTFGEVSSKRMFGGHGLFFEGKMFGLVDSQGQSYLKADDSSRSFFEGNGAIKHGKMPYFSIPEEVLKDFDQLQEWANKAIDLVRS